MMKINLNFAFKTSDGQELSGESNLAGKILAGALAASSQKHHVLKIWGWTMKLSQGETLDLDTPDCELLVSVIENCEGLTLLAKGQLLQAVSDSKKT